MRCLIFPLFMPLLFDYSLPCTKECLYGWANGHIVSLHKWENQSVRQVNQLAYIIHCWVGRLQSRSASAWAYGLPATVLLEASQGPGIIYRGHCAGRGNKKSQHWAASSSRGVLSYWNCLSKDKTTICQGCCRRDLGTKGKGNKDSPRLRGKH